jgi:tRNA U34 5-carboxymethylaminomethyl modifying GTPase MnmE/TrmE
MCNIIFFNLCQFRAFFNGKLSAAQVESLSDLIYAKTSSQLHLAKNQERAGTYIKPLKERVMRLLVMLEAEIDFAEDICSDNELNLTKFLTEIHAIAAELRKFLRSAHRGSLIRSGVNIALVGRTNVGKSSIMNKLGILKEPNVENAVYFSGKRTGYYVAFSRNYSRSSGDFFKYRQFFG